MMNALIGTTAPSAAGSALRCRPFRWVHLRLVVGDDVQPVRRARVGGRRFGRRPHGQPLGPASSSDRGSEPHRIDLASAVAFCDSPDHRYRHRRGGCKHLVAVGLYLSARRRAMTRLKYVPGRN
jgi:hypothetical protein